MTLPVPLPRQTWRTLPSSWISPSLEQGEILIRPRPPAHNGTSATASRGDLLELSLPASTSLCCGRVLDFSLPDDGWGPIHHRPPAQRGTPKTDQLRERLQFSIPDKGRDPLLTPPPKPKEKLVTACYMGGIVPQHPGRRQRQCRSPGWAAKCSAL